MPDTKNFVQAALRDQLSRSYPGAFAASDIQAVFMMPGGRPRALMPLAAISVSTHRDKFPVTSMPFVNPRGFTQGHRTIAGTLMFHTVDRHAFLYAATPDEVRQTSNGGTVKGPPLPDEQPLFDIHLTYVNDVGMASFEAVYGITILDMGRQVSLECLVPMESYSYMALDYQPLAPIFGQTPNTADFTLRALSRDQVPLRRGDRVNSLSVFDPDRFRGSEE